jgi:hypothetical protein
MSMLDQESLAGETRQARKREEPLWILSSFTESISRLLSSPRRYFLPSRCLHQLRRCFAHSWPLIRSRSHARILRKTTRPFSSGMWRNTRNRKNSWRR